MPDLSQLSLAERFPLRPGYGAKGAAITVWANYFVLNPPAKLVITRYSMSIDDGQIQQQRRKRRQVISLVLKEIPGYEGRENQIATDFADNLICVGKIPDLGGTTLGVRYQEDDEDEPKSNAKEYRVTFEEVASYDIDDVMRFLNSPNVAAYPNQQDILGAFNILLRYFARVSDRALTMGAKAFPTNADFAPLGYGLVALKGFFSSVRFASSRILVNVNVASGAFYSPILVSDLIGEFGSGNLTRLEKFLKGLRVELTHIPKKKKGDKLYPRIKTIFALARKGDGSADAMPPRVARFGAGAKEVEFFLTSGSAPTQTGGGKGGKGKGKGGAKGQGKDDKGPKVEGDGRYISVYDYFKTRGYFVFKSRLLLTLHR